MRNPQPVVSKGRGGYKVLWGSYAARIHLPSRVPSHLSGIVLHAELFSGGKQLAQVLGTRAKETVHLYDLSPGEGIGEAAGLRYCGVLTLAVEAALKQAGVKKVCFRTNNGFGSFARKIGYRSVGKFLAGTVDIEKTIGKRGHGFPFRIMPARAKRRLP